MAKKRLKANKPAPPIENETKPNPDDSEKQINAIIEKGRKKGFLTYDEINDQLPEDAISPARLDNLLATLDEIGIKILDEADIQKQPEDEFEFPKELGKKEQSDKILEKELATVEVERRVDDPIRMYLTQMGEIPLLSRENEIALARKIELARMGFRRKLLESEYCARNAIDILIQVQDGTLSFDRTMKISTAENLIRSVIKKRMIPNLQTTKELLEINQRLFNDYQKNREDKKSARSLVKQIYRNKRKIATLLEELSLRTSRIQPMKNKLHGISHKMEQLRQIIQKGPNGDVTAEDIDSMKQELAGLQDLITETPEQLDRRLNITEKVFTKYEDTKRTLSSANLRLVVSIAKKYRNRGLSFLDIIQEGNTGLMRAVDKY